MNAEAFEPALALAGEYHARGVVILHDGSIAVERYWDDWNEQSGSVVWSVTKSIVSVLVGLCLTKGSIESLEQPVGDFLIKFKTDPRNKITIRHLLSMTSGLEKPALWHTRPGLIQDERAFSANLSVLNDPGEAWDYNTIAFRILYQVIQEASGQTLTAFTREWLFEPLGMGSSYWRTRGHSSSVPNYLNLVCSPRDLARFGLLVQHRGNWRGQQLVRRDYMEEALRPSQPHNPNFGLLFWLNGQDRRLLPSCPADTVIAMGADDSRITIVPSLKLVVTRLGKRFTPAGDLMRYEHGNLEGFHNTFMGLICDAVAGNNRESDSGRSDPAHIAPSGGVV